MLLGGDGIRQLGSNDEEVSRIMEMTGSQAMLGERPREIRTDTDGEKEGKGGTEEKTRDGGGHIWR